MVFDREGYSSEYFYLLQKEKISFITWEKYTKKEELENIPDESFNKELVLNGKTYKLFEGEKEFKVKGDTGQNIKHFFLRRVHIWNTKSNKRICGLANDYNQNLTIVDIAKGILTNMELPELNNLYLKDMIIMNTNEKINDKTLKPFFDKITK